MQLMAENFAIWDFELDQADMDRIASLDTACSQFFSHQDPQIWFSISS